MIEAECFIASPTKPRFCSFAVLQFCSLTIDRKSQLSDSGSMGKFFQLTITLLVSMIFLSLSARADETQESAKSAFSESQLERLHQRNKRKAETA